MGLMNSRKIDLLADLIKICDFNLQLSVILTEIYLVYDPSDVVYNC